MALGPNPVRPATRDRARQHAARGRAPLHEIRQPVQAFAWRAAAPSERVREIEAEIAAGSQNQSSRPPDASWSRHLVFTILTAMRVDNHLPMIYLTIVLVVSTS